MTQIYEFYLKQLSFKGRSGRTEYWTFYLVTSIASQILGLLANVLSLFTIISMLFTILVFVPSIAIMVRRLHDLNLSGGWLAAIFAYTLVIVVSALAIPVVSKAHPYLIGILVLLPTIYLAFAPGKNEGNRYTL